MQLQMWLLIHGSLVCSLVMFYSVGCAVNKYLLSCRHAALHICFPPSSDRLYIRSSCTALSPGPSPGSMHASLQLRCPPEHDACWLTYTKSLLSPAKWRPYWKQTVLLMQAINILCLPAWRKMRPQIASATCTELRPHQYYSVAATLGFLLLHISWAFLWR